MYFFYFFPLGLDRPTRRRPLLTWAFMATLVVVFAWQRWLAPASGHDPYDFVFFPGNGRPWTVLTAVFLHGSWLHLMGNLLYLHVLGPPLEDRLGRFALAGLGIVLGIGGNLAHGVTSVFGWFGQADVGVMGASGAIAGLMALVLLRFYSARVVVAWWVFAPLGGQNRVGRTAVPVPWAVPLWVLLQVVQMLLAPHTGTTVSFGAHLGGFGLGVLVGLALGEWRAGRAEAAAARARAYFRAGHYLPSVGAWTEVLAARPNDVEAMTGLARGLVVAGQTHEALRAWRRLWDLHRRERRLGEALKIYDEATRAGLGGLLNAAELAEVARTKELQGNQRGALDVYHRLYQQYPRDPQGQRALVRIVVLCRGGAGDEESAQRWLDEAHRVLPTGPWLEMLEREFRPAAMRGAGAPAGRPVRLHPAGS